MDPPHVLSQAGYLAPIGVPYAPAPDGKRFVIATYPEGLSSPLVLVTNWNTDFKK